MRFGGQNTVGGNILCPNVPQGRTLPLPDVTENDPVYYRDAALSFCSSGTTNPTNAVAIA